MATGTPADILLYEAAKGDYRLEGRLAGNGSGKPEVRVERYISQLEKAVDRAEPVPLFLVNGVNAVQDIRPIEIMREACGRLYDDPFATPVVAVSDDKNLTSDNRSEELTGRLIDLGVVDHLLVEERDEYLTDVVNTCLDYRPIVRGPIVVIGGNMKVGKSKVAYGLHFATRIPIIHRETTRQPDETGMDDVKTVSRATFARRRERGVYFVHWEENGHCYGIPLDPLTQAIEEGRPAIITTTQPNKYAKLMEHAGDQGFGVVVLREDWAEIGASFLRAAGSGEGMSAGAWLKRVKRLTLVPKKHVGWERASEEASLTLTDEENYFPSSRHVRERVLRWCSR